MKFVNWENNINGKQQDQLMVHITWHHRSVDT